MTSPLSRAEQAREALTGAARIDRVRQLAVKMALDHVHHEVAIADPFKAETVLQDYGGELLELVGWPAGAQQHNGDTTVDLSGDGIYLTGPEAEELRLALWYPESVARDATMRVRREAALALLSAGQPKAAA